MIEAASATRIYADQSEQKRDHIAGLDAKEHGTHEACDQQWQQERQREWRPADQQTFTQNQHSTCPCCAPSAMRTADFRSAAVDAIGERAIQASGTSNTAMTPKDGEAAKRRACE